MNINLNHYRIGARCGYKDSWPSINHCFSLCKKNYMLPFLLKHLDIGKKDIKIRKNNQHTGVRPMRKVMIVRPSSRSKAPKLCNRTPDLIALVWMSIRAEGSVKLEWLSSCPASCFGYRIEVETKIVSEETSKQDHTDHNKRHKSRFSYIIALQDYKSIFSQDNLKKKPSMVSSLF